jgi:hypothetical protein
MTITPERLAAWLESSETRKLYDEDGLYVLNDKGSVGWRYKYRFGGVAKGISFGPIDQKRLTRSALRESIKRARKQRDDARNLIADGIDPSAKRKAERLSLADTFRALAEEWLDRQKNIEAGTLTAHRQRLVAYVYPTLGSLPVRQVTAPQLLIALRRVEGTGKYDTTRRVYSLVHRILSYGVATGRAERNAAADINVRDTLIPASPKNHAAIIEPKAVGALLRAIDG